MANRHGRAALIVIAAVLSISVAMAGDAMALQGGSEPSHGAPGQHSMSGMSGMSGMHHHHAAEKLPPGNDAEGRKLFTQKNCIRCHSTDAPGKNSAAGTQPSFGPNLSNLFNPKLHGHRMTDGDVEYQIRHGGGKGMRRMPPFGSQISPQEMADLVAYLHTLTAPGTSK